MIFNEHKNLQGKHAFLSGSNYHWLRYDEDKLLQVFDNYRASEIGTELHEFAKDAIRLGVMLAHRKRTLNMYVNDCIKNEMQPEVTLRYSNYCFGTADAISFRDSHLFIFDYKSGRNKASMDQLKIYAAIFCLEYMVNPKDIFIELRIYQSNQCRVEHPESEEIVDICERIIRFNTMLEDIYGTG